MNMNCSEAQFPILFIVNYKKRITLVNEIFMLGT